MNNIEKMKTHYMRFDQWAESLRGLSSKEWNTPVGEGKWSVAAVIAHLLFWDKYSLKERFPFFKEGAELPAYPDFQTMNDRARRHAEEIASKEQILDDLIETRKGYHDLLAQLEEDKLALTFKIADHSLTAGEYLEDFIQHDQHHQKQVDQALGREIVKESI